MGAAAGGDLGVGVAGGGVVAHVALLALAALAALVARVPLLLQLLLVLRRHQPHRSLVAPALLAWSPHPHRWLQRTLDRVDVLRYDLQTIIALVGYLVLLVRLLAAASLSLVKTLGVLAEGSGTSTVAAHSDAAVLESAGHRAAELRVSELAVGGRRQLIRVHLVHQVVVVFGLLDELLGGLALRRVRLLGQLLSQVREGGGVVGKLNAS